MLGRKLSLAAAAKQLSWSSPKQTSFFHTGEFPQQSLKSKLLSAQREIAADRSSRKCAAEAPPATRRTPPCALAEELLDTTGVEKRKDCDARTRPRSWKAHSHATGYGEADKKKKKKKRAPPGPIEFESLTCPTPGHSDLPFAFRYSYTEIPKVAPVGFQEKYSPFGPGRLDRVWDGQQAIPVSSSSSPSSTMKSLPAPSDNSVLNMKKSKYTFKGVRLINPPNPLLSRAPPKRVRTREEVLGEPLTPKETKELVEQASKHITRRQINMGRDGLTHNMLIEIQDHWKRQPVVRIRCKGVCTVDMDNVHFQLEDKTGGKIIERLGGTLYMFRGRNFSFKDRPIIPPMLWKPHAPLYPKLMSGTPPGGLKAHEAFDLRKRGRKIMRLCILSKNAYYGDLIRHVREAFEDDELVRIDCKRLNTSDYKKIGAKLRDLVPCYLLSFDKEQIILWRGRDQLSSNNDFKNSKENNEADAQLTEGGEGKIELLDGQLEEPACMNSCLDIVHKGGEECHSDANASEDFDGAESSFDSSDDDAQNLALWDEKIQT